MSRTPAKKSSRKRRKEPMFKVGDIYEDCSYHPVVCTLYDKEGDSIEGVSLLDASSPRCCSLIHCAVRKLTEDEARERMKVWHEEGERGLMKLNGWPREQIDKFMKNWRQPQTK